MGIPHLAHQETANQTYINLKLVVVHPASPHRGSIAPSRRAWRCLWLTVGVDPGRWVDAARAESPHLYPNTMEATTIAMRNTMTVTVAAIGGFVLRSGTMA